MERREAWRTTAGEHITASPAAFLQQLVRRAPFPICEIQTDKSYLPIFDALSKSLSQVISPIIEIFVPLIALHLHYSVLF